MKTQPVISVPMGKVSCGSCSLSELCLPKGLTSEELKELDVIVRHTRKVDRGEYLYRSGEPLKSIYAVRSGSFKTTISNKDGAEQVTGFQLPGELMGMDAFGEGFHKCNAQALESSTICELPYSDFERLSGVIKGLRRQFLSMIGKEISHDHMMMLTLGQMAAEERLATFLYNLSQRHRQRGFSEFEFVLTMPRHDMANYLGLAVETVSRLFSRMQDEKILEVSRRNIRIIDMPALCSLAHVECRSSCKSPA